MVLLEAYRMSSSYITIKLEKKRHIAWIFLDRPDKLNAINPIMLQELSEAIDNVEEDTSIRCAIISSTGEKSFSTGADLTELQKLTPETATEFSSKGQHVFSKLEKLSKPVVAAIIGYALGGGLELALACDFRIASYHAQLGCPEIELGLIPAWGATQRLPRTVGLSNAKWMIMLGDKIQAEKAHKIGLVDKVVPPNEVETEAEVLAQRLCEFSPAALKYAKCAIESGDGMKKETKFFSLLFSLKNAKKKIENFGSQRNKQ